MSSLIIAGPGSCQIGNISAVQTGWTHLADNNTYLNQAFTWGIAEQNVSHTSDQGFIDAVDTNFLLGIPATVQGNNLDHLSPYQGCALFFEGVAAASNLDPPLNNTESSDCNAILGSSCVDDLVSLTQTPLQKGLDGNSTSDCTALQAAISKSPPQSCSAGGMADQWSNLLATGQSYGTFGLARTNLRTLTDLVGPETLPFIGDGYSACYPTPDESYRMILAATSQSNITYTSGDFPAPNQLFGRVHPIMTVWYTDPLDSHRPPSVSMTCLRTIGNNTNGYQAPPPPNAAPSLRGEQWLNIGLTAGTIVWASFWNLMW